MMSAPAALITATVSSIGLFSFPPPPQMLYDMTVSSVACAALAIARSEAVAIATIFPVMSSGPLKRHYQN